MSFWVEGILATSDLTEEDKTQVGDILKVTSSRRQMLTQESWLCILLGWFCLLHQEILLIQLLFLIIDLYKIDIFL